MSIRVLSGVVLVLLASRPLGAQTTGRLVGEAVDSQGQPVSGATVTVSGPSLQGTRVARTNARGEFLLAFLPPGSYGVRVELAGFQPFEATGVRVELDHTATVRARLELAALKETVSVVGASPLDLSGAATGLTATAELYTRLPLDRSYLAVARIAPGTQQDEVGAAVYGATGAENQYVIDGLNVTGVERGTPAKELNLDFVEAVEVKTGGLPAEYGRSTGGIVNVLTKSGGNDWHGSGFGFFSGGSLLSENRTAELRSADDTSFEDTTAKYDFGAELGGRIVRDRLWFYGAYNYVAKNIGTHVIRDLQGAAGAPEVGAVLPAAERGSRFAGKLTWRTTGSSTLALSVFGDPGRFEGPVRDVAGPPASYLGTNTLGGTNLTLRYQATFGRSFLVQATAGSHRESRVYGGAALDLPSSYDLTVTPPLSTGGIGGYTNSWQTRKVARLDASKVVGRHELKLGADVEELHTDDDFAISGGGSVAKLEQDGVTFYQHGMFLDVDAPDFAPDDPATWQPVGSFRASPRTRNVSGYPQDSWRIGGGVVLNLGVRYERQRLFNYRGEPALGVDNWAPRVNAAWDVGGRGRSKLYAGFGRYFESIPQLIGAVAFGGLATAFTFNFDPDPLSARPDLSAPYASEAFGGRATPVAPGIRGQYVDEWLLGYERQLPGEFVVGGKAAWRRLGRLIEDTTSGDGQSLFANPGEGPASTIGFFDGSSAPNPGPKRDNYSLEVSARKRLSHGWQMLASYLWTRLRGNYDGNYQRSTGFLLPNWNPGFDSADFMVNVEGPLTSESVHQLKLDGSYELSGRFAGLDFGLSTHLYSGLPLNARGLSFRYFNWEYYLVPRGSLAGRHPADYEVDLHASYRLRVSKALRLALQADLFNLLDRQAIVIYDERYNRFEDGPCAGVPEGLCSGDGGLVALPGTLDPVASLTDPRATATSPDYLVSGRAFSGQRSLRLGLRLSF